MEYFSKACINWLKTGDNRYTGKKCADAVGFVLPRNFSVEEVNLYV